MVFDNKKEHKEFYLPPKTPGIVNAPAISFLAARGHGEPEKQARQSEMTSMAALMAVSVSFLDRPAFSAAALISSALFISITPPVFTGGITPV